MPLNSFISSFQVMQASYKYTDENNNEEEIKNKNKDEYFRSQTNKEIINNDDDKVKNNPPERKSIVNFQGRRSFDFNKETDNCNF